MDEALLQRWETELTQSSLNLIEILITNSDRKIKSLQEQIGLLESEIKDLNLPEGTVKNYLILDDILNKQREEIKQRKARKLRRDEGDYNAGRVFTFAKRFDHLVTSKSTHKDTTVSSTSLSSTSSEVTSDAGEGTSGLNTQTPFSIEMKRLRMGTREVRNKRLEEDEGVTREGVLTRSRTARN